MGHGASRPTIFMLSVRNCLPTSVVRHNVYSVSSQVQCCQFYKGVHALYFYTDAVLPVMIKMCWLYL